MGLLQSMQQMYYIIVTFVALCGSGVLESGNTRSAGWFTSLPSISILRLKPVLRFTVDWMAPAILIGCLPLVATQLSSRILWAAVPTRYQWAATPRWSSKDCLRTCFETCLIILSVAIANSFHYRTKQITSCVKKWCSSNVIDTYLVSWVIRKMEL